MSNEQQSFEDIHKFLEGSFPFSFVVDVIILCVHIAVGIVLYRITKYEIKYGIWGIQSWIRLHNGPQQFNSMSWICRNRLKRICEYFLKLFVFPGSMYLACPVLVFYFMSDWKIFTKKTVETKNNTDSIRISNVESWIFIVNCAEFSQVHP